MKRFSTTLERNGYKQSTGKGDYSERCRTITDFHDETDSDIAEDLPKTDAKIEFSNTPNVNDCKQNTGELDFARRYSYMRKFHDERSLVSEEDTSEYLKNGEVKLQFPTTCLRNGFKQINEDCSYRSKYAFTPNLHEDSPLASDDDIPEELPDFDEKAECSIQSNFDTPEKRENKENTFTPQTEFSSEYEKDSIQGIKVDIKNIKRDNDTIPAKVFPNTETEFAIANKDNASVLSTKHDGSQYAKADCENINSELKIPLRQRQTLSVLTIVNRQKCTSPDRNSISPTSIVTEPRVALKKLKEQLDKNDRNEEIDNFIRHKDNIEEETDEVSIIKDTKLEEQINRWKGPVVIDLEDVENNAKENEVEAMQKQKQSNEIEKEIENNTINKDLTNRKATKSEHQEENTEKFSDKCSKRKSKSCFHFKKKESNKCKSKRCQIM